MTARRFLPLPIAAVAVLGITGCQKTLDTSKAEKTIKKELAAATKTDIKSVSCPSDVKAKKGNVFKCTAEAASGQKITIKVTQKDNDGNVEYALAK